MAKMFPNLLKSTNPRFKNPMNPSRKNVLNYIKVYYNQISENL